MLHERKKGRSDELRDIRGRGAQGHCAAEVGGCGPVQKSRRYFLVDVSGCLPGRHVEGQLVLRALQPIGGCDLRKYCVVGTGDGAVHGSVSGMVGELQVHEGGRALGVDVQLQRVQCALVRFPREPRGEAAAEGGYGRLVGSDEALGGCQIGCQRIGREVRRRWGGGHLCLQRGHGGRVGPNGGGVGGRVREGRIGRQDRGQLPCRDALHLDGGDGGLAIVEDVPGDGRLEKTHALLSVEARHARRAQSTELI